jgi:Effector-associated domain 11
MVNGEWGIIKRYLFIIKSFTIYHSPLHYSPFIIKNMRLEKVKNLISDGRTQEAIDLLQEILKDKDKPLLNQTLLLESQLKELQRKMQLGLQDATADLNRINFTLLTVCDDASNLLNIDDGSSDKPFSDNEKPTGLLANPLAIFGIIAAIGIAIVVGIVVFGNKAKVVQPLPLPVVDTVKSETVWLAAPPSATVLERYYGNVKADILSIKATTKDINTKILTLDMQFNCLKSSSGACIINYLRFQLVGPNGNKTVPLDDVYFAENPKDGQTASGNVAFVISNQLKQADLQIYYIDKMERTLVTVKLNTATDK